MRGVKQTLLFLLMISQVTGTSFPAGQDVAIRYLVLHLVPSIQVHTPDGIWTEDTLQGNWIRMGGPAHAFQQAWWIRTASDSFPIYLGEQVDTLDLALLQPISWNPSSPVRKSISSEALQTVPSPPSRIVRTLTFQDTLHFDRLTHLSTESREKLQQFARQVLQRSPHRVHLRAVGAATSSGDPLLNQKLARWRAHEVIRTFLRYMPPEMDVSVKVQTVLNATGKWAFLRVEVEP